MHYFSAEMGFLHSPHLKSPRSSLDMYHSLKFKLQLKMEPIFYNLVGSLINTFPWLHPAAIAFRLFSAPNV